MPGEAFHTEEEAFVRRMSLCTTAPSCCPGTWTAWARSLACCACRGCVFGSSGWCGGAASRSYAWTGTPSAFVVRGATRWPARARTTRRSSRGASPGSLARAARAPRRWRSWTARSCRTSTSRAAWRCTTTATRCAGARGSWQWRRRAGSRTATSAPTTRTTATRSTDVLHDELPRSSVSPGRGQTLALVPRSVAAQSWPPAHWQGEASLATKVAKRSSSDSVGCLNPSQPKAPTPLLLGPNGAARCKRACLTVSLGVIFAFMRDSSVDGRNALYVRRVRHRHCN